MAANSNLFSGLIRMFVPSKHLDHNDVEFVAGTGTGFSGQIKRGRRPFRDGYIAKQGGSHPTKTVSTAPSAPASPEQDNNGIVDYLNEAAERFHVMHENPNEPEWRGGKGWSGDRRSRRAEGFHSIKM